MKIKSTSFAVGCLIIGIAAIALIAWFPKWYWLIVLGTAPVTFVLGWYCVTRDEEENQ